MEDQEALNDAPSDTAVTSPISPTNHQQYMRLSCIQAASGDVEKARQLYEFVLNG